MGGRGEGRGNYKKKKDFLLLWSNLLVEVLYLESK